MDRVHPSLRTLRCGLAAFVTLLAFEGFWLLLPDSGLPGTGFVGQLTFLVEAAGSEFSQRAFSWLILLGALAWCYHRLFARPEPRRLQPTALLLALLFTLFALIGAAMERLGALEPLFAGKLQLAVLALGALGFFCFFYGLFCWGLQAMPRLAAFRLGPLDHLMGRVQGRRPLAGPFAALLLCWAPVWLIAFPGALASDAATQIAMYFLPDKVFNNHYPFLSTLFYSGFVALGNALGQPNLALFLLCAIQYVLFAFALAHLLDTLRKLGASGTLRGLTLLVFAFVPLWPTYAVCVQKDTPFAAGVILTMDLLAETLLLRKPLTGRRTAALLGLGLLVCLTRNNGIYLFLPLLLALLFAFRGAERRRCALLLAALMVSYGLIQSLLMPAVHCSTGEKQEMLSIPFQQTARYVQQYGDEVTEEEREAIDGVLLYDELAQVYDPYISDAVKMPYRYRFYMSWDKNSADYQSFAAQESEALSAYFQVWFAQFLKHPMVYFEATLHNIYGYFYPVSHRVYGPIELDTSLDAALRTDVANFTQLEVFAPLRTLYSKAATALGRMPITSLLFAPCVTVWGTLLAAACLLRKKRWKTLICLIPSLMTVAICIASPVNACTRYMLCATALLPLLFTLVMREEDAPWS